MSLGGHLKALFRPLRKRFIMAVLSHRVRAKNPTMDAHPTAIWDYGFGDLDAIEIGRDVSVGPFAEILVYGQSAHSDVPGRLIIGDKAVVSMGCDIRAAGGTISIGAGSVVSQQNVLVAANHVIRGDEPRIHVRWDEDRCGIEIGGNVWVGAGCIILPGTVIGDNAVIAAGSVVRGTIPPGELWGGVPARKIRTISLEKVKGPKRTNSALPFGE